MFGPTCAFLSSVTWAIGSSGYSRLSTEHSAFTVNFSRALVALPLFVLASFVYFGGWDAGWVGYHAVRMDHVGWFSLSMLASYGLGDALFLWSTLALGVPAALAISSSYPLWTAMAGFLLQGERLAAGQWLGLVITVAGLITVILASERTGEKLDRARLGKGVLLALASSLMWAVNGYAVSRGGKDLAAPVGNTVRMILALFVSAGFGKALIPSSPILLPRKVLLSSLWLFVGEAFLGSYLFMYGLSHTELAIGATLSALAPVISVPVACLLGLERFSVTRSLGVAAAVMGLCLLIGAGPFL